MVEMSATEQRLERALIDEKPEFCKEQDPAQEPNLVQLQQ